MKQNMLFRQLERYARVHGIKPKLQEKKPVTGSKSDGGKKNKVTPFGGNEPGENRYPSRKVKIDTNPVVRLDELPEKYQDKFKKAGELANQNKTLHAELKFIAEDPTKEERRKLLANLITENVKSGKKLWKEIDTWWAENSKLTPEQIAANEAIDKEKRIRANKNYISRYHNSTKPKQIKEVELRKAELKKWGVDYENLIGEDKSTGNTEK